MTDLPDDSNSSRLNRRSVERLRERFGDALPAEGAAETEPETPPLTGLALRLAEALAEKYTVPKRGKATEATDWENPILDTIADRINKGMAVHFIAEDGHPSFRDASPAEAVAVIMPLIDEALHNARHVVRGRCRYCRGILGDGHDRGPDTQALLGHQMRCRFYVGPLDHYWTFIKVNGTFGGVDHNCSCGGWFRQGGMAGHGDGSEDAEPVCPNVDQGWRGPRDEAT